MKGRHKLLTIYAIQYHFKWLKRVDNTLLRYCIVLCCDPILVKVLQRNRTSKKYEDICEINYVNINIIIYNIVLYLFIIYNNIT